MNQLDQGNIYIEIAEVIKIISDNLRKRILLGQKFKYNQ